MRFTFVISQIGVVEAGLLDAVGLRELALLNYLAGWTHVKANTVIVDGREYRWIDYAHAISENPLLFHPDTALRTHKNTLAIMVQKLRVAGLVETVNVARRLHFALTEKAARLDHGRNTTVTKSRPIVMPTRDDTVMENRDDRTAPNIDEEGTKESSTRKEGRESLPSAHDEFVSFWNSATDLPKIERMTPKRNHALAIRLRDPFFAAHWREAIQRTAASPFCTGKSERGWRANLDWFLTAGSVEKILEGNYDAKPARVAQRPIASVNFNQTNFRASL